MSDAAFMDRALQLASIATGTTAPNPPVGAVIVRDGEVLGEGFTRPIGGPHAEVVALADAEVRGHDVAGATMYVTLEPCCHHGRTPPCSEAIIGAGIARVVVGVLDPFEQMQGRSIEQMRAAGLAVELGVGAERAARTILGFARAQRLGLPEVTAKAGVSLDGHIATASGESQWITSPAAREDGHRLRARHDAVLVGIGTVLADDPRLDVRLPPGALPGLDTPSAPAPVVLDTDLRTPADARLFATGRGIVICADDAPERDLPGTVIRVRRGPDGHVDPVTALRAITDLGHHRVLVEGGGIVHRALFDAGVVDTLVLYVSGKLIPGGRPWLAGPPLGALADAVHLALREVTRFEPDVRLTWDVPHVLDPDAVGQLVRQAPR